MDLRIETVDPAAEPPRGKPVDLDGVWEARVWRDVYGEAYIDWTCTCCGSRSTTRPGVGPSRCHDPGCGIDGPGSSEKLATRHEAMDLPIPFDDEEARWIHGGRNPGGDQVRWRCRECGADCWTPGPRPDHCDCREAQGPPPEEFDDWMVGEG